MSDETVTISSEKYLELLNRADETEKRNRMLREDLDEALDWVEAGESVLIPMLRMHGVETAPLVHFDMLVSKVHRTGLIERLDNERWRPVDGEELPLIGQMRIWTMGFGKLIETLVYWDGDRPFSECWPSATHWRPAAKGPGGEDE